MAKKQAVNGERVRCSAKAERIAVLRLLRGEARDALSRELKVAAAKLSERRETVLAMGEANLMARDAGARDELLAQLKQTLGELTLRLELQCDAVRTLKAGLPFAPRAEARRNVR